ncbi:MAG TPA: hypothetical protein VKX41_11790 [Alloacidobacterium sp.]|jgi:hypothetical protein|nr:hypothetical protein [Alloacidobacterium sp.]
MTFLQHVGICLKKVLHIGEEVAVAAEPIVDIAFPDVSLIYNSAIGLAISAESTEAQLTGTGPQKLAQAMTNLEPQVANWAKQNNIAWDQAAIEKWLSAIVDTLNMIPAPTTASAAAPAPAAAAPVPASV